MLSYVILSYLMSDFPSPFHHLSNGIPMERKWKVYGKLKNLSHQSDMFILWDQHFLMMIDTTESSWIVMCVLKGF